MHKKILYILLFSLTTVGVYSQSFSVTTDSLEKLKPKNELNNNVPHPENAAVVIFKKNNFPSNQKVSPEIFYIINDKPVSREEYVKQNKHKQ
jgi:hypothetical protein